jgi:hypothetical protein
MQKDNFVEMFEYLYKQTVSSRYKYSASKKDEKLIDIFLSENNPYYWDSNRMFEFLCFQFFSVVSWDTKETVQLSWIIGDKAIERWCNRSDEQLFLSNAWKLKNKLINKWIVKPKLSLSESYKEQVRVKNCNNNLGLYECLDLRLYSVISSICKECNFNSICMSKNEARKENL